MATVSPHMGLRVWNLVTDPYDHDQLADNFFKLDFHDHTNGRGVQIPTEGIADGAVTGAKLAAGGLLYSNLALDNSGLAYSAFSVYRSTNVAITTANKVNFDAEEFDLASKYDSVTNFRFVAGVAGYYRFNWRVSLLALTTDTEFNTSLYKNGVSFKLGEKIAPSAETTVANVSSSGTSLVAANQNDYFEIFVTYDSAGTNVVGGASQTYFQGHLVGLKT